jgi:hypothetical protein
MSDHWKKIAAECEDLQEVGANGKLFLKRERIVEFAREHPESEVYQEFKGFNVTQAAEQHWLWVAGQIIDRIRVYIDRGTPEPEGAPVQFFRKYTSVQDEHAADGRKRIDVLTVDLLADPIERNKKIAQLLKQALGEARGYPQLHELDEWRQYTQQLIDQYSVE